MTRYVAFALAAPLLLATGCCSPCEPRCRPTCAPTCVADAGPAASATVPMPVPTPAAAPAHEALVLQVHPVADLTGGDEAKMTRLIEKVRAIAVAPGGSAASQGDVALVVKTTPGGQRLVQSLLAQERTPLRLRYFDVKDLVGAHPTLLEDLTPMLAGADGATMALKAGTLIVRASSERLDAVGARLEAMRAPK